MFVLRVAPFDRLPVAAAELCGALAGDDVSGLRFGGEVGAGPPDAVSTVARLAAPVGRLAADCVSLSATRVPHDAAPIIANRLVNVR